MKAQAVTQWVRCRPRGGQGVYVAHPHPGGWRYAELSDERLPEWVVVTAEEFKRRCEVVSDVPASNKMKA